MRDFATDLYGLRPLMQHGVDYYFCGCNPIYKNTNERLKNIYEQFDFNQKDVFSVLSSSDQIFSAYYLGARNVDTFDSNWTTYYHFYLRKWYLMFYFQYFLETKSETLIKSLAMRDASCEEERKVCEVWQELLIRYKDISKLFYRNTVLYEWNVPCTEDIERFINIIKDKQANFTELDISKEISIERKYDIVILSNILESIHPEEEENLVICQNLRKILKDDGIVICSILTDRFREMNRGREAFQKNFDYEISSVKGYNKYLNKKVPLYYTYKKKS